MNTAASNTSLTFIWQKNSLKEFAECSLKNQFTKGRGADTDTTNPLIYIFHRKPHANAVIALISEHLHDAVDPQHHKPYNQIWSRLPDLSFSGGLFMKNKQKDKQNK